MNTDFNSTKIFLNWIRPEEVLTVSQWSDKHRYLSNKASAEPGKYRTARAPYMREIMDLLSTNDTTEEIVFMKAAQVGATEAGNNWIGYIIDHSPAPVMLIQPTVQMAERNSKQRIDPLIEESPRLRTKIKSKRSRDSGNTVLSKDFPGGTLIMTGANSAVGLRSMPARFIFFDEEDAYPGDAGGEGSPIELAKVLVRTFSKRKLFYVSTPTIDNRSEIQRLFEMSDQRYYEVPCIHCGEFQVLEFDQLKWEKDKPETAKYLCIHCGAFIENYQKTPMLQEGKWVPTKESRIAGFHISALYSPVGWYSWEQIATDWIKCQKNNELRKTFFNTVLGRTWVDRGEAPDWHRLYERRENYKIGTVPKGVCFLTCGVDVQADRLEAEVVGWGKNKESWSIDYRIIRGSTTETETWTELEKLLHETFIHETSGIEVPIKLMAVDSGYNTQLVYEWCRKFSMARVIAIKGHESLQTVFGHPKAVDLTSQGRKISGALKAWPIGVNLLKSELYGFLRQNMKTEEDDEVPHGYCHFPNYAEEYFQQLTAEELQVKIVKGYRKHFWQKIRDRNESLDCRVYARAAAAVIGLDRMKDKHLDRLETELGVAKPAENSQTQSRNTGIKRRKSEWL